MPCLPLLWILFALPQGPQEVDEARRVTMSGDVLTLDEIFREIGRQTGETFEVEPEIAADTIRLNLEKAHLFHAVEEVCRIHGSAAPLYQTFTRTIQIRKSTRVSNPYVVVGPVLIRIQGLTLLRANRFSGPTVCHLMLDLLTAWESEPRLLGFFGPPKLSAAVAGDGISLLEEETERKFPLDRIHGRPEIMRRTSIRLAAPPSSARSLPLLEGRLEALWIREWTRASIPSPVADARSKAEGGMTFHLKTFVRSKETAVASLELLRDQGFRGAQFDLLPPSDRFTRISLVDGEGRCWPGKVTSAMSGPERCAVEIHWNGIPPEGNFRELTVEFAAHVETETFHFRFQNVDLP